MPCQMVKDSTLGGLMALHYETPGYHFWLHVYGVRDRAARAKGDYSEFVCIPETLSVGSMDYSV